MLSERDDDNRPPPASRCYAWPRRASTSFVLALARCGRCTLTPAAAPALTGTYPGSQHNTGPRYRSQTLETVKHHLKPNRAVNHQMDLGKRSGFGGPLPYAAALVTRVRVRAMPQRMRAMPAMTTIEMCSLST